ncbi:hypothetical protein Ae201684_003146 [Aphanomyces euteiches]|uniref:Major facilitator superfamily (MFS) profile domain-containing protein n=2 Tax=Aphanomyces euteiches TaxID=100861 RepID=A0A6G0XM19_9STRA|nr:hypothetical protein Ae201684_003146 [Aphanomyces euteiches]
MASKIEDAAVPVTPNDVDYVQKDAEGLDVVDKSQQEGMSIPMMFLVCCPKMAMNMAWAAQWAALGPLLQVLLSYSSVQGVQIVGPTSGLLVAPFIGVLSDATISKYGRRKPWLFWGAVTSIICWAVMMNATDIGNSLGDTPDDRTWTTVFVVFCYVWMDITCNLTQVPVVLLIADLAGNRQVTAASIGQAWSIAGSLVVSGCISFFGPAHQSIKSFMGMLMVIMFVCCMSVCWFVKEEQYIPTVKVDTKQQLKDAFSALYVGLRKLPKVLALYCVIFLLLQYGYTAYNGAKGQFFGIRVKNGLAPGADTCGTKDYPACTDRQKAYNDGVQLAGGVTDTIFNIFGWIYLLCMPFLVRKIGAKWVIVLCCVPQVLLIIMAFCKVVIVDQIIVVLVSISQQTIFALQLPMIVFQIGLTADNNLGMYAGAFNSANCAGQFLNFALATQLVKTSMTFALPVLVGGILSTVALFVAIFFLKFDMKTM